MTNPAAPARVIRGKRRCPLEDSGGIWGYQQLIVAVSDPTHEEHHDFAGWAHSTAARSGDTTFDPDHFDLARTNEQLTTLFTQTARLGKVQLSKTPHPPRHDRRRTAETRTTAPSRKLISP